ncbi:MULTISPECIES: mechanosensitive ion channel family protein [Nocardioides]|uniref:Mechanosensitive ion channel domain-containing protein n=1 Tax=Nocardioides kribbensis TaxID=305517 RepID=A0ABV1NU81_9ACTN|nr:MULTISPECIES: mechanosensitive ion channel domain-containing protein [Nocardioides]KQP64290.1 mechanosensitive ion channel protein MscS [Nocardioides sp. Leaf285]KQQ43321.1 mechanosensitive ion channel protein MscS [Nocardioides sp. Leaf307]MBJ7530276.1 mechanosensitive ion channel [Nocardioides sp.]MCM3515965.1 mechanosensitive ion channel family protein [Nocardioides sp. P86]
MRVSWTNALIAGGSALLGALALIVLTHVVARLVQRRWPPGERLFRQARVPYRVLVLVIALNGWVAGVRRRGDDEVWWHAAVLAGRTLWIIAAAWLVTVVLLFLQDLGLGRARTDVRDNRAARRVRTQVLILRRLTVALMVVVALGAILLSFPGVRTIGASVLASAGLISVVAALAAQSTLANVFAGIQLAFSDAIRIDDVVIVEEEWGWIEEITLSYVVVRLWDDRRMVLPSTYFTTTPFQNWTRRNSELLGAVELDLDWRVDTARMREALPGVMASAGELWDGRVSLLQVTDAVAGFVRVRVLVTAVDAGTLFDLRCHVREQLVAWLRDHDPAGLPRTRLEVERD